MRAAIAARLITAATISAVMTTSAPASELPIKVKTVSGPRLDVWRAYAEDDGDYVRVRGTVRRPRRFVGIIPGHLHVVVTLLDGRPDVIADTRWAPTSSLANFGVRLPIADASSISSITVSYVGKDDVVDTNPGSDK